MSEIARGASGDSKPKLEDGRTSFRIKFRRRRGEPLQEGLFHIRIPSLKDDSEIARMKIVFSGGVTWTCLDPKDQMLFEAMAVCQVLVDRPIPQMFDKPVQDLDSRLIFAVSTKIRQHEAEFFRGRPEAGDGEQEEPCLEIVPAMGE